MGARIRNCAAEGWLTLPACYGGRVLGPGDFLVVPDSPSAVRVRLGHPSGPLKIEPATFSSYGLVDVAVRVAGAAIAAMQLTKIDANGTFIPTAAGDSALLQFGVALTAASGTGREFEQVELKGQLVLVAKDGIAISRGDDLKPSATVAGACTVAGAEEDVFGVAAASASAGAAFVKAFV